jgi:hypothetical protein
VTSSRRSRERGTIVVLLDGSLTPHEVRPLCLRTRRLLLASGAELLVCDVRKAAANCVTVDALARLQLTARRLGCPFRLRHASRDVRALLDFAGLRGIVPARPASGMPAEAEEREEALGVEERVQPGDPTV